RLAARERGEVGPLLQLPLDRLGLLACRPARLGARVGIGTYEDVARPALLGGGEARLVLLVVGARILGRDLDALQDRILVEHEVLHLRLLGLLERRRVALVPGGELLVGGFDALL